MPNPIIYQRRKSDDTDSSMSSQEYSYSQGTAPSSIPSLDHNMASIDSRFDTPQDTPDQYDNTRASVNTYASTTYEEEPENFSSSYYSQQPKYAPRPAAVPSTPTQFAELFPREGHKLRIKHDESLYDGNMNIRVDCDHPTGRLTLFHVRMYDLRDRDMSVRRYGRDCGREVAKIKRRFERPHTPKRPALQRSMSKVVNSFLGKHEHGSERSHGPFGPPQRQDSGYASGPDPDFEEDEKSEPQLSNELKPTNTCVLEFSNYAHVEITRKGQKANKKYEFEYWGKDYAWKRTIEHEGQPDEQVSFTLYNKANHKPVATIVPDELTPEQEEDEYRRGTFVPPCTMKLHSSDADPIQADRGDIADVIITTGLIALIDDHVKRKFHKKRTVQIVLPAMGKMNMEYVGPRRFFDEMMQRRPGMSRSQSAQVSRAGTPRSGTPVPSRRPTD